MKGEVEGVVVVVVVVERRTCRRRNEVRGVLGKELSDGVWVVDKGFLREEGRRKAVARRGRERKRRRTGRWWWGVVSQAIIMTYLEPLPPNCWPEVQG